MPPHAAGKLNPELNCNGSYSHSRRYRRRASQWKKEQPSWWDTWGNKRRQILASRIPPIDKAGLFRQRFQNQWKVRKFQSSDEKLFTEIRYLLKIVIHWIWARNSWELATTLPARCWRPVGLICLLKLTKINQIWKMGKKQHQKDKL